MPVKIVTNPAQIAASGKAAAKKAADKKKSGKAVRIPTYHQPPFDPRITTLSKPFGNELPSLIRRGFMVWDKSLPTPSGNYDPKDPASVQFLFNPSTISTSYSVTDGSAQAALNYSSTQGSVSGGLLLPLQQQTSFTIMFDRTYEMNDAEARAHNTDIANYGVDVDVAALRQYTGMYADVYAGNSNFIAYTSSNTQQSSSGQSGITSQVNKFNQPLGDLAQGFMQVTIGYLYFGGVPKGGKQTLGITYYGYIDSWSVEYTHFDNQMVPMRCVCDISFSFLPPPTKAPDTAGASKISQSQTGLGFNDKGIAGLPNGGGINSLGPASGINVAGR